MTHPLVPVARHEPDPYHDRLVAMLKRLVKDYEVCPVCAECLGVECCGAEHEPDCDLDALLKEVTEKR